MDYITVLIALNNEINLNAQTSICPQIPGGVDKATALDTTVDIAKGLRVCGRFFNLVENTAGPAMICSKNFFQLFSNKQRWMKTWADIF